MENICAPKNVSLDNETLSKYVGTLVLDGIRPLSLSVPRTFCCSPQSVSTAYCVAEHCVETLYPQFPPLCLQSRLFANPEC